MCRKIASYKRVFKLVSFKTPVVKKTSLGLPRSALLGSLQGHQTAG